MEITTQITLSPEELESIIMRAITPLYEALRSLELASDTAKYAYTVAEVALLIGYSEWAIRDFIKKGRIDKRGKLRLLPVREITTGTYRITPKELKAWLLYF